MSSRSKFSHPPAVVDAVGLALQYADDVALLEGDLVAAGCVVIVESSAVVRQATGNAVIEINLLSQSERKQQYYLQEANDHILKFVTTF